LFQQAKDSGGSIFVHVFGAYFGLAVSFALGHGKTISQGPGLEKEGSSYNSDIFAMIGKLPEVFQTREIWENIICMTQFEANVRHH
jgi:ammonia channel protein AmtB